MRPPVNTASLPSRSLDTQPPCRSALICTSWSRQGWPFLPATRLHTLATSKLSGNRTVPTTSDLTSYHRAEVSGAMSAWGSKKTPSKDY